MFKNYFKLGFRNLNKRKLYSFINILGLSVGITFSMLIGAFIYGELQVDQSLKDIDRLFMLNSNSKEEGLNYPILVFPPAAKVLKEEYPNLVEDYYRWWDRDITVTKGDLHFRETTIIGDPSLLDMFGFSVLHGNKKNPLKAPGSVVITKKLAIKYFGKTNVVGEILTLETEAKGSQPHQITAVLDDIPRNSVTSLVGMNTNVFLPVSNISSYGNNVTIDRWDQMYLIQYIKLLPGVSLAKVNRALESLVKKHAPETVQGKLNLQAIPLHNYYLKDNNSAKEKMVITLSATMVFILLMAIINFVNISIGTSSHRLKEIGIRKAIGGIRKQLIIQFLVESFIITLIATIISLFFYQALRPYFIDILGQSIKSIFDFNVHVFILLGCVSLLIGIVSGFYPAVVLSSYNSVESLKGKLRIGFKGILFKRGLITFQFALALFVFLSSVIISKQVDFFFNKNLGYDKSSILTISSVPRDFTEAGLVKSEMVKNELKKLPQVEEASLSWVIPNGNYGGNENFYKHQDNQQEKIPVCVLNVDEDFLKTYGLRLKEGKFFQDKGESWQREKIVLNEAAVKALGLKNLANEIVKIEGADVDFKVAGVVQDFNFFSLHETIKPIAFIHVKNRLYFRYISIKLKPGNLQNSVQTIQKKWSELFPNASFEYKFMDEKLEEMYKSELQLRKAASTATYLSIIIVMLGVLGLVSLSLAKRTKEIGIRKVLGASVTQINLLFLKEFALLLLMANLLAWPLAYFTMKDWLHAFVYKIDLTIDIFIIVSLTLFLMTGILIWIQSAKTAMLSPVKSLRTE